MGYATAHDLALAAPSLEVAVRCHLQSNCYPPVPVAMVEPAVAAIQACTEDDHHHYVALPDGVSHRVYGCDMPAHALVTELRLEAFVGV